MYACLSGTSPRLVELARQFSPLVEPMGTEAVVFSIAGLERLIGDAHQIASEISRQGAQLGVIANLAIAGNPSAAALAARNIVGVTIIPLGQEAEALAARMQFLHDEAPGLEQPELLGEEVDVALATAPVRNEQKLGRNELCYCGSGKKFKHCHGQIQ